jgi:hypothetical protein
MLSILVFLGYYQLSHSNMPQCNAEVEGELFYDQSAENSSNGDGVFKYCDGQNWVHSMHTYGECKAVKQIACGKRNANAQCGDGYVAVGGHSACWVSWDLQAGLAQDCGMNFDDFHDQKGVQDVTSELYVSGFSKGRKGWLAGCSTKKLVNKTTTHNVTSDWQVTDKYCKLKTESRRRWECCRRSCSCNWKWSPSKRRMVCNRNRSCRNVGYWDYYQVQVPYCYEPSKYRQSTITIKSQDVDYASGFHAPKMAIAWCCKAPQDLRDKLKLHKESYDENKKYWD